MTLETKRPVRQNGLLQGQAIHQKYVGIDQLRGQFQLREQTVIPACTGKAFLVDAGQAFRIVQVEGPQIGDVWFFNRDRE